MTFSVNDPTLLNHILQRPKTPNENTVELVKRYSWAKNFVLGISLFKNINYLPKSIQIEFLKSEIIRVNTTLYNYSKKHSFNRPDSDDKHFWDTKFILDLIKKFSSGRHYEYINYDIDVDEIDRISRHLKSDEFWTTPIEINLPYFKDLTDCLSLLMHYLELVEDYEALKSGGRIANPEARQQLNPLGFNDVQRGKLYDLLVSSKYIPDTTLKTGFIWAFGGKNSNYSTFTIKWESRKNLLVYLIDQLCFDQNLAIQTNYFSIACKIFGFKQMSQTKDGYKNNNIQKPLNHKLIDDIIANAKK